MKSHTVAAMSLGKRVVYGTSTQQKLNTMSSTEAELVGVSDILPQVLWMRYFLEIQGYGITDSIVYQDNESTIKLDNNGRGSSGKRTAAHLCAIFLWLIASTRRLAWHTALPRTWWQIFFHQNCTCSRTTVDLSSLMTDQED